MGYEQITEILGTWEGYRLDRAVRSEDGGTISLVMQADGSAWPRCSGCGRKVPKVHDRVSRRVRDLPILECRTTLVVDRRRVACVQCCRSNTSLSFSAWDGRR